jgi:hypothetical protein
MTTWPSFHWGGTLVDSYRPYHTQRVMQYTMIGENARIMKGCPEPRVAERGLRLERLILQGRHEQARANSVCRQKRMDVYMRHPFGV